MKISLVKNQNRLPAKPDSPQLNCWDKPANSVHITFTTEPYTSSRLAYSQASWTSLLNCVRAIDEAVFFLCFFFFFFLINWYKCFKNSYGTIFSSKAAHCCCFFFFYTIISKVCGQPFQFHTV